MLRLYSLPRLSPSCWFALSEASRVVPTLDAPVSTACGANARTPYPASTNVAPELGFQSLEIAPFARPVPDPDPRRLAELELARRRQLPAGGEPCPWGDARHGQAPVHGPAAAATGDPRSGSGTSQFKRLVLDRLHEAKRLSDGFRASLLSWVHSGFSGFARAAIPPDDQDRLERLA